MVNTKGNLGSVYASKITSNKGWFILYAINSGMGQKEKEIT
jgi:NCS1 family nucleobase:cation symporter-1